MASIWDALKRPLAPHGLFLLVDVTACAESGRKSDESIGLVEAYARNRVRKKEDANGSTASVGMEHQRIDI